MKRKFFYSLVIVLALAGVFGLGYSFAQNQPAPPLTATSFNSANSVTVAVLVDDGNKIVGYTSVNLSQDNTVLGALKSLSQSQGLVLDYDGPDKSTYGSFVKQIGDKKNGTDQKYWQYWVNGSQPLMAADKYQLKGGETILWTFRKSQF